MDPRPDRHRFSLSITGHALWLYHRVSLSERAVQEVLHVRGIVVSHEKKAPMEDQVRITADGGTPPPGAPSGLPVVDSMRCALRSVARNTDCGGPSMIPAQTSTFSCNPLRGVRVAMTF